MYSSQVLDPSDPATAAALTEVAAGFGAVTEREFAAMAPFYRDETLAWLRALPGLDDRAFLDAAEGAIASSSVVASFRSNYNHLHCRASAAYHHGAARDDAAGRDPACERHSLYARAWRRFAADQGLASPPPQCRCAPAPA